MKKDKKRMGKATEVGKLTIHDWNGELLYRIKGKTSDKKIGVAMIDLIEGMYNLSEESKREIRKSLIEKEKEAMKPTFYPKGREPVKWTRDEKGNIRSPFRNFNRI